MPLQTYKDIWIRWIHAPWEKSGEWRTGIQVNVLDDQTIKNALFILEDYRCVFVPMSALRTILSAKRKPGVDSIVFNINPRSRTIDGKKVADLAVITSQTERKKKRKAMLDDLVSAYTGTPSN